MKALARAGFRLMVALVVGLVAGCGSDSVNTESARVISDPVAPPGKVLVSRGRLPGCAGTGQVVAAADSLRDVEPNARATDQGPVDVPDLPGTDLAQVQVLAMSTKVCFSIETAGESTARDGFRLTLRAEGGSLGADSDPIGIGISVFRDQHGEVSVYSGDAAEDAAVRSSSDVNQLTGLIGPLTDATASADATRISVVIPTSVFDRELRSTFKRFSWQVLAVHTPEREDRSPSDLQFFDCLPDASGVVDQERGYVDRRGPFPCA
jgi:hypothetical protein